MQPPQPLANGDAVIQAFSDDSYISDAQPRRGRRRSATCRSRPARSCWSAGAAAHFVDLQHSLETHLPIALAIVIVATLIVLFLMTGSVVLPVK